MSLTRHRVVASPPKRRSISTPEPAESTDASPARRDGSRDTKLTDGIQAGASVAAAVLAAVAVAVAGVAFADQRQINKSQQRLNQLAEERASRRYASRVAWWADSGSPGTVFIQNRSPAPLSGVFIGPSDEAADAWRKDHSPVSTADDEAEGIWVFEDIPPCIIVKVRIPGGKPMSSTGIYRPYVMRLYFQDPLGGWVLSRVGLQRLGTPHHIERPGRRKVFAPERAEDCGEGG